MLLQMRRAPSVKAAMATSTTMGEVRWRLMVVGKIRAIVVKASQAVIVGVLLVTRKRLTDCLDSDHCCHKGASAASKPRSIIQMARYKILKVVPIAP